MGPKTTLDPRCTARLRRAVQDAADAAMEALRGEVTAAQVMPFDQGVLQNTLTSVQPTREAGVLGARLVVDGPYARRLYHHPEYAFRTAHNPNARGEWFEPWLAGGAEESFLQETFAVELKRRMP